jgi:hypothetical protein
MDFCGAASAAAGAGGACVAVSVSGVFAVAVSDNCSVRFLSSELVFLFVLFCLFVFMVFFFDLCCSVSDSRPSPTKRAEQGGPWE